MDDYTAELFVARDEAHDVPADRDDVQHESDASDTPPASRTTGLRGRVAALGKTSSIQDRLLEKLLQQVIPADGDGITASDDPIGAGLPEDKLPAFAVRPNFNITTMSNNFRRFNARIGVVFTFQARVLRLLSWHQYSHTLSFLAIYTFVCLDPYLLSVVPLAGLLVAVFIPSFLARHPAPPRGTLSSEQSMGYSARGPPLAPARTVKPVKELSKDFFRNMRDLQNCMEDFSQVHDQVVTLAVPITNFSNEALSSALFLFLSIGCVFMSIAANILPWRFIFLVTGWSLTCMGHPTIARLLVTTHKQHLAPQEARAKTYLDGWVTKDIILDSAPETREVEIFELQRMSAGGEWEPWLFAPSPYDPLSQNRITGDRPRGTRFFEDVLAPDGWEWSEKKWALDLWSREWVEERIITSVEVETEGERWVYDMYDENEGYSGVVDSASIKGKAKAPSVRSWEEGEDGGGRRGEWRRRRWVRLVKRRSRDT